MSNIATVSSYLHQAPASPISPLHNRGSGGHRRRVGRVGAHSAVSAYESGAPVGSTDCGDIGGGSGNQP